MKQCSPLCSKILGVVRIVFGLWMLWAGISKLSASPEMMAGVGSAGHLLGLTFLSTTAWFWIAVVGEILAGLFLVSGCCKLTKVGAWLTIIIMIFALNMLGWTTPDTLIAWLFVIVAGSILLWGRGSRCFCAFACCKGGACCKDETSCGNDKDTCCGGVCMPGIDKMKDMASGMIGGVAGAAGSMLGGAKDMVGDAAGNAKEIIGTAAGKAESVLDTMKDTVGNLAGKADGLVDVANGMVDKAKDMLDKVDDVVIAVGGDAGKKMVDMAKGALDKADAMVDKANAVVDKADDMLDKKVEETKDAA